MNGGNLMRSSSSAGPDWTIAIPAYNRASTIGSAVRSAVEALGPRTADGRGEVLVVDNHSSDTTADVAETFDGVRVVRFDETVSMFANHNRCARESRGRWIVFLHSDDRMPAGWIEHLEAAIGNHAFRGGDSRVDAVVDLDWHRIGDAIDDADDWIGDDAPTGRRLAWVLAAGISPPSGNAFRRETLLESPLDEHIEAADLSTLHRWMVAGRVVRHRRQPGRIWSCRGSSASGRYAFRRRRRQLYRGILQPVVDSPHWSAISDSLIRIYPRLTAERRSAVMYQLAAGDQQSVARRLIGDEPRLRDLARRRTFWTRDLPSLVAPATYHAARAGALSIAETVDRIRRRAA